MPNPKTQKVGRPHLARDRQQWIFDYIVQQSGHVFHWWGDNEDRMPKSVRSHGMISKHYGNEAQAREAAAKKEAEAGNREAALKGYYAATRSYASAQHPIFENNAEKLFLYEGVRRCYDKVIEFAPYTIEVVDVPFEGNVVSGFLHLCPNVGKAPLLFYFPGCDGTCEGWPNPTNNPAIEHGMHVFSFDGPGQAQSNVRGIRLTADNYERATSAVLDVLLQRPEIDADRVVGLGGGMGSFYALRAAALDERFKAVATKSSYADKYYLMDEDGPRWKQLYAYLTQASTEEELDATMSALTLDGYLRQITCPVFMATGEYDHRDPIEEVYDLFDQLQAPAELWVFADRFHQISFANDSKAFGLYGHMLDWIDDRLAGKPMQNAGEVLYIEPESEGPDSPGVSRKRRWFETPH